MLRGYVIVKLNQRLPNVDPDLITRFKWRAERRCRKRNAEREVPTYRFEVCDWLDGRWAVVAMQNQAQPITSLDPSDKVACACRKCSTNIHKDEWTFPYCSRCYNNPKCK
jgi:hypothetical protein